MNRAMGDLDSAKEENKLTEEKRGTLLFSSGNM